MLKIQINGKELDLVKKGKEKIADLAVSFAEYLQDFAEELRWKAEAFSYYSNMDDDDSMQNEKQEANEMHGYGNYEKPVNYGAYEKENLACSAWMFCDPDKEEEPTNDIDGQMHFEEKSSEKCANKWENSAISEDEKFTLAQYLELTSNFNSIFTHDEQSIREYCEEIGFPVSKYSMKIFEKSEDLKNKKYFDTGWFGMEKILKEAFPDEDRDAFREYLKLDFEKWLEKRPDIKKHCNKLNFRLLVYHFISKSI